jgi:hypothetical protein
MEIFTTEMAELVAFAYKMHADGLNQIWECSRTENVPHRYIYSQSPPLPEKFLDNGYIVGRKVFPNHDYVRPLVSIAHIKGEHLGETTGRYFDPKVRDIVNGKCYKNFRFKSGTVFRFDPDGFDFKLQAAPVRVVERDGKKVLDYCFDDSREMADEMKLYINGMVDLGFRRGDVVKICNGAMGAEAAFLNVASGEVKEKYLNAKAAGKTIKKRGEFGLSSPKLKVFGVASSAAAVRAAIKNGAGGIGLVRTENILKSLNQKGDDIEVADWSGYQNVVNQIATAADGLPVIYRVVEEQPVDLQARAIANGAGANCKILIPRSHADVCETIGDIRDAVIGARLGGTLSNSKRDGANGVRIGVMVEDMEGATQVEQVIFAADFLSFGLNDLTESITGEARDLENPVFNTIRDDVKTVVAGTVERARRRHPDLEISFCGNHTNRPQNLEFFKSLGAHHISCAPEALPDILREV